MSGKWQTLCQVIPVDRLSRKEGIVRRGQREVERESDCFRNEWRQCLRAKTAVRTIMPLFYPR